MPTSYLKPFVLLLSYQFISFISCVRRDLNEANCSSGKMTNATRQYILAVFAVGGLWMCCFEKVRVGYVCFMR